MKERKELIKNLQEVMDITKDMEIAAEDLEKIHARVFHENYVFFKYERFITGLILTLTFITLADLIGFHPILPIIISVFVIFTIFKNYKQSVEEKNMIRYDNWIKSHEETIYDKVAIIIEGKEKLDMIESVPNKYKNRPASIQMLTSILYGGVESLDEAVERYNSYLQYHRLIGEDKEIEKFSDYDIHGEWATYERGPHDLVVKYYYYYN